MVRIVPADTTREAFMTQFGVYGRMTPVQRLQVAFKMSDFLRDIAAAGVRNRHPDYTEAQVRQAVIRQTLGDDLFRKAYPGADLPGCTKMNS